MIQLVISRFILRNLKGCVRAVLNVLYTESISIEDSPKNILRYFIQSKNSPLPSGYRFMKKEEDKITKKIYADAALTGIHGIVVAVVGCRGPVRLHGLGMFQKIHKSKRGKINISRQETRGERYTKPPPPVMSLLPPY